MKSSFAIFKGRSLWDTVGLSAVLGLFVANAFHFNLYQDYAYYREMFNAFFIVLSAWYWLTNKQLVRRLGLVKNRLFVCLLLFPVLLFMISVIDPGVTLYGELYMSAASEKLLGTSLKLYVLRNALLYLPLVVYLYLRGLNVQELRLVAIVAIMVAPLSILAYLQTGEMAKMALTLGGIVEVGNRVIAYNSYAPYLTFSVLCGFFLLFSPGTPFIKSIVLVCVSITVYFIVFSSSRQSVLFVCLSFAAFFFMSKERRARVQKWWIVIIIMMVSVALFVHLTRGFEISHHYFDRYGSVVGFTDSNRIQKAITGLKMLNFFEWMMGAGLTSVVNSGPHNDYVRWMQRIGFPLMIFGFFPFFLAFLKSARLSRHYRSGNTLYIFLTLTVGFTLFHSLFGYPREDANQAVAVYLGIALWFGALRTGLVTDR